MPHRNEDNEACRLHEDILKDMQNDIREIKTALLGDDLGGAKGALARLLDVEIKVVNLEKAMIKLDLRVSVITISISGLLWLSQYLIKHLMSP